MKKDPDMVPRNPHALETFAEDILSLDDQSGLSICPLKALAMLAHPKILIIQYYV